VHPIILGAVDPSVLGKIFAHGKEFVIGRHDALFPPRKDFIIASIVSLPKRRRGVPVGQTHYPQMLGRYKQQATDGNIFDLIRYYYCLAAIFARRCSKYCASTWLDPGKSGQNCEITWIWPYAAKPVRR
ncbi:MAG: hypothetical protein WCK65_04890, partial [Rhodospirillaceae bacterium]